MTAVAIFDFDFYFRRTPANVRKLRGLAADLEAVLMKPYYPVSGMLRISRDEDGLQLDFMGEIHGVPGPLPRPMVAINVGLQPVVKASSTKTADPSSAMTNRRVPSGVIAIRLIATGKMTEPIAALINVDMTVTVRLG